jgi:2-keto-4-pentenoate hydratase/2-oxohepta-3-ene-1,7-dioic acid hydratase in catechol pathway
MLDIPDIAMHSVRGIAGSGSAGLERIGAWLEAQPGRAFRSLDAVEFGPVVPDPGAIYTIGRNYAAPGEPDHDRPERPMVLGKLASSVAGHGSVVSWDRAVTANVDAEVELGVVIGEPAVAVTPETAMRHVFGYTCINDMNSTDPWLDGDQWLLGKSLAGFCPVGPWVVTADEIDPGSLGMGCTIDGVAIQDGNTNQMRYSIAEVISYISRHVTLRPGDLIATGTPGRISGPIGPDRRLQVGDVVTVWIERIGELTTIVA